MTDFTKWSYTKHAQGNNVGVPGTIFDSDTLDTWLHTRMHEMLLPLIESHRESQWLTVGDGRFGSDANFLLKHGAARALATDISDETLKEAVERGFIREFAVENAEKLSFEDESFDFVLCKEAYHHLPRPPVAFYEMLRVARVGVALIEPIEGEPKPLDRIRTAVKRALRGDENYLYEGKGNFLYRTTLRELEKMMIALDLDTFAHKRINTLFMGRSTTRSDRLNRAFVKLGILAQDALCKLSLMNFGIACAICFKSEPELLAIDRLQKAGFIVRELPRNPYVERV